MTAVTAAIPFRREERAVAVTPVPPASRWGFAFLVLWVPLLLLIPERYTILIPGISGMSMRPAEIVTLAALLTVGMAFVGGRRIHTPAPIAVAIVFVGVSALSVALRAYELADEHALDGSFRVLVQTAVRAGVALAVANLAVTPQRRRILVVVAVVCLGVSAGIVMREASTGRQVLYRMQHYAPILHEENVTTLAGFDLTLSQTDPSVVAQRRGGLPRPAGPAKSPIEVAGLMALAVGLAFALAASARGARRLVWLVCLAAALIAVVLSLSRSGLVAGAAMLAVGVLCLRARPKQLLGGVLVAVASWAVLSAVVPQAMSSFADVVSSHSTSDSDPSIHARTSDYREIPRLLGPAPLFGRGTGALATYKSLDGGVMTLDNQYLMSAAETGLVGAGSLIALIGVAAMHARRRVVKGGSERAINVALLGCIVAFGALCATFDSLRFSQFSGVFFLAVGLVSTV
jgi:hypothetical protein